MSDPKSPKPKPSQKPEEPELPEEPKPKPGERFATPGDEVRIDKKRGVVGI